MKIYSPDRKPTLSSHLEIKMYNNEAYLPLERLFQHHDILMSERLQHPYLAISCLLNNLILVRGLLEFLDGHYINIYCPHSNDLMKKL